MIQNVLNEVLTERHTVEGLLEPQPPETSWHDHCQGTADKKMSDPCVLTMEELD